MSRSMAASRNAVGVTRSGGDGDKLVAHRPGSVEVVGSAQRVVPDGEHLAQERVVVEEAGRFDRRERRRRRRPHCTCGGLEPGVAGEQPDLGG